MFICISMSLSIKAQTTDSIFEEQNKRIESLQMDISNIQQDFKNFNRQYKIGTNLIIGGLMTSIVGGAMAIIIPSPDMMIAVGLPVIGGLLCLTGAIIHIDAHKYLGGKASLSVGQNGVGLKVNF